MLGNFSYSNPTRLYFGDDAIAFLGEELKNYGKKVFEDPGVMSNPTVQKLYEGCRIAKESWMKEIGVVLSAKELGVTEDMIDGIADATFLFDGGYKALTRDEVVEIVKESLREEIT